MPVVRAAAESKAVNLISRVTSAAVDDCLSTSHLAYQSFVSMEQNAAGQVTSLSFRSAQGASFKRQVTQTLSDCLEEIPPEELEIPLGTLSGILIFSALGPSVRVRIQSLGDVSAEYHSEFSSAGVNQTRHALYLELRVTVYLLIPGEIVPVTSVERVCIAETIIVGEVPETYLNLQDGAN